MRRLITILAGATLFAPAAHAAAQTLATRVANADAAAVVRFAFPSRPGVCGDGESIEVRSDGRNTVYRRGSYARGDARFDEDGRLRNCQPGPVVLELTRTNGRVTAATARVGGRPGTDGTDLGMQDAAAAVDYLLAPSTLTAVDDDAANNLIFAATLSPVETWPALLQLARTRGLGSTPRSTAMFWLSHAAGDRAAEGLQSIIGDDSDEIGIREHAVFALSRMQSDSTIPRLMQIARTNREPAIRRNAMFWLGRSGDPRVIDFFEAILSGR